MTDQEKEFRERLKALSLELVQAAAEKGPTSEGARLMLVSTLLRSVEVAWTQRPDHLHPMASTLFQIATHRPPANLEGVLSQVRRQCSFN